MNSPALKTHWIVRNRARRALVRKSASSLVADRLNIAESLVAFTILIEDKRFWWHIGFDPVALARAALMNLLQRGMLQGASTITEQVMKVDHHILGRTFSGRGRRLLRAVHSTISESKSDVLIRYLSGVYFGRSSYGVHAAAQRYFDTDGHNLTIGQSFFLAERIATPGVFRPGRFRNIISRTCIRTALSDQIYCLQEVYGLIFGTSAATEVDRIIRRIEIDHAS